MTPQQLQQLVRRWQGSLAVRDLAYATGTGCAALAVVLPSIVTQLWAIWVALAVMAGTLAVRSALSRWWRLDAAALTRHLDRVHPELEESCGLWLRDPAHLALLEQLQLKKINSQGFPGKFGENARTTFGAPPRRLLLFPAIFWLGCSGLLGSALVHAHFHPAAPRSDTGLPDARSQPAGLAAAPRGPVPLWPKITGVSLTVTPPAYTGRPARRVEGLGAEAEEGARVAWTLSLDRPVCEARLVFGETDALPLAPAPRAANSGGPPDLLATRTVAETALYHLAATLPDGRAWNPPDLYSLKVVKDRPPTVRIVRPGPPRTLIDPPPPGQPAPRVDVEVAAGDDYGVGEAHLVATVAKGSGEAVKFREQTLPFEANEPDPAVPRGRLLRRTLDLGALGLEPGDELYFFVEALDNRQPTPNRTRSETRFLVLKGPEETALSAGKGLSGVNLVPQYFRSERQIIIDTEKLIADRPHLTDRELRQRSNDLGGDQQLLRLRYGQFLGEEMEEGTADHNELALNPLQAAPPQVATGPRAAASVSMRFLQEHQQQDREGGSDEQRDAQVHPSTGTPPDAKQAVAPFVDQHDSQDKATLFDHDTRGTMRDVLDAMWQAERHLRVMQLDDALPPEHRALDILKDLQQSARSYVQHVGFEPPPLKIDQRRGKGDVAGVPGRAALPDTLPPDDPTLRAVRAALADLPWHRPPPVVLLPAEADLLRRVEPALTTAATRQPERFLAGLQALRQLHAGEANATALTALQQALLRLLPPAGPLPARPVEAAPSLAGAYFDALQPAASDAKGGTHP